MSYCGVRIKNVIHGLFDGSLWLSAWLVDPTSRSLTQSNFPCHHEILRQVELLGGSQRPRMGQMSWLRPATTHLREHRCWRHSGFIALARPQALHHTILNCRLSHTGPKFFCTNPCHRQQIHASGAVPPKLGARRGPCQPPPPNCGPTPADGCNKRVWMARCNLS